MIIEYEGKEYMIVRLEYPCPYMAMAVHTKRNGALVWRTIRPDTPRYREVLSHVMRTYTVGEVLSGGGVGNALASHD